MSHFICKHLNIHMYKHKQSLCMILMVGVCFHTATKHTKQIVQYVMLHAINWFIGTPWGSQNWWYSPATVCDEQPFRVPMYVQSHILFYHF